MNTKQIGGLPGKMTPFASLQAANSNFNFDAYTPKYPLKQAQTTKDLNDCQSPLFPDSDISQQLEVNFDEVYMPSPLLGNKFPLPTN